jgi:hypothetical protein
MSPGAKRLGTIAVGLVIVIIAVATLPKSGSKTTTTTTATTSSRPSHSFSGTANTDVGTIRVSVESVLKWDCAACRQGTFVISGSNSSNSEGVNTNETGQSVGHFTIDPGTYRDVRVITGDHSWTMTITSGSG